METNEIVRSLEVLCSATTRISGNTQGRGPIPWQTMIASLVFGRVALNSLSILRLCPGSCFCSPVTLPAVQSSTKTFHVWDLPSVASLSRNLIEAVLTLHYMTQTNCTESEFLFREKVWRYHESFERLKMLHSALPRSGKIEILGARMLECRGKIETDPLFQNLEKDKRQRILRGEISKLLTNEELCVAAGINPSYYNSMFKYSSNHTHSSPFSYAQMDAFSAQDDDALAVFRLALQTATGFLAVAIEEYVPLFPDQTLTHEERKIIDLWRGILKRQTQLISD